MQWWGPKDVMTWQMENRHIINIHDIAFIESPSAYSLKPEDEEEEEELFTTEPLLHYFRMPLPVFVSSCWQEQKNDLAWQDHIYIKIAATPCPWCIMMSRAILRLAHGGTFLSFIRAIILIIIILTATIWQQERKRKEMMVVGRCCYCCHNWKNLGMNIHQRDRYTPRYIVCQSTCVNSSCYEDTGKVLHAVPFILLLAYNAFWKGYYKNLCALE